MKTKTTELLYAMFVNELVYFNKFQKMTIFFLKKLVKFFLSFSKKSRYLGKMVFGIFLTLVTIFEQVIKIDP